MKNRIEKKVHAFENELIELRRHFHQHPELGFKEFETAKTIAGLLEQWGVEVTKGVAGTGVVGLIRGGQPGRTIALRADMDALPIEEKTGLAFSSHTPGVMHACGHDGHTAILLGAAKVLSELKDNLRGNVKLIFQPAEEGPGGAKPMIAAGVLANPTVDAILGLHIWPELPSGSVGITAGPVMAAMDRFDITVKGVGGHGAIPHRAVDPVVAASHVVTALQTIASREIDPLDSVVVSTCTLQAGTAFNIIPHEATLSGTVRSFSRETREKVPQRIGEIVAGVTTALGCDHEYTFSYLYPATVNHEKLTGFVRGVTQDLLGDDRVGEIPRPSMGGEDFSFYQEKVPGTYLFLGTRNEEKGLTHSIHHPEFTIDEEILAQGVALFCNLAVNFLNDPGAQAPC